MWKWFYLALPLFGAECPESMLLQASAINQKFNLEIAKASPPSLFPQVKECLIWFTIDLNEVEAPAFDTLSSEELWDTVREIGANAVYFKDLKKGKNFRTGIGLDPTWGSDWNNLSCLLEKKGLALVGNAIGPAVGLSADFGLALKNVGAYPSLYHLIEIEKNDWKLLPQVNSAELFANVPWLKLQDLQKKGYVPEDFDPYVKESSWNATGPVQGGDGKVRRWIYLKEGANAPMINWLSPSFAGFQIASADILDSFYNLGQKGFCIDARIGQNAQETLALWARKIGSFSVLNSEAGIQSWKAAKTDLLFDHLTRPALLHALIAEDAEALKVMYRLFLEEDIQSKRLVHLLQPFNRFSCDYTEFLDEPKRRFSYYEEVMTGQALRTRLLKEDVEKIRDGARTGLPSLCTDPIDAPSLEKHRSDALNAHLLLALFYAMQPGTFAFSLSDLLGLEPNGASLYGSLSSQMKNSCSFAIQLKNILATRIDSNIGLGTLIDVPKTKQKGLLVLIHRLPNQTIQLLAVNFSKAKALQAFEMPSIAQTTAINLMTRLAEKKPLSSTTYTLEVPALSGKVILFQPKYYN